MTEAKQRKGDQKNEKENDLQCDISKADLCYVSLVIRGGAQWQMSRSKSFQIETSRTKSVCKLSSGGGTSEERGKTNAAETHVQSN